MTNNLRHALVTLAFTLPLASAASAPVTVGGVLAEANKDGVGGSEKVARAIGLAFHAAPCVQLPA